MATAAGRNAVLRAGIGGAGVVPPDTVFWIGATNHRLVYVWRWLV